MICSYIFLNDAAPQCELCLCIRMDFHIRIWSADILDQTGRRNVGSFRFQPSLS